MRRKFLLGIGLFASAVAGAGSAIAADISARPAPPPPPIAPAFISDWAGFYIGINGGGAWARSSFESQEFESFSTTGSHIPPNASPSGGVFGFQAGHNWQWGPVVGGLEIDFDGASVKDTSTFFFTDIPSSTFTQEVRLDELASARARLGYLIFPNWLLFGTVGLGYGHARYNTTETSPGEFISTSNFANEFGWVVGAGLEWKFIDHWLLRGEWLHYDFGRDTITNTLPDGSFNVRTTVDVARAALSYKF